VLEHTADLGLCLQGADLPALFDAAAHALFDRIAGPGREGRGRTVRIAAQGSDAAELLVNFLRELLYQWNGRRLLLRAIRFEALTSRRVLAQAVMVAYRPGVHALLGEIKAVTYHQARVVRGPGGWQAAVVLDV
jgi:SHS2 domain-containing protein